MNRFQSHYDSIVSHDLLLKDHFLNVMHLPKLDAITLNIGLGKKAVLDKKQILVALTALELISQQKPCITRSKKSIDKFKLRANMPLGSKVTLRRSLMFSFLDSFIHSVLPRFEDLSESFSKTLSHNSSSFSPSFSRPFFYSSSFINLHPHSSPFLLYQHNFLSTTLPSSSFVSFNLGVKDFFVFSQIPYEKFDTPYGLDINLLLRSSKHTPHLFTPTYFLSSFQMPLGSL